MNTNLTFQIMFQISQPRWDCMVFCFSLPNEVMQSENLALYKDLCKLKFFVPQTILFILYQMMCRKIQRAHLNDMWSTLPIYIYLLHRIFHNSFQNQISIVTIFFKMHWPIKLQVLSHNLAAVLRGAKNKSCIYGKHPCKTIFHFYKMCFWNRCFSNILIKMPKIHHIFDAE